MRRTSWLATGDGLALLTTATWAADLSARAFVKKPAVAMADGKATITFPVDCETDVAVFVEDATGKVIRHLVAGMLGRTPSRKGYGPSGREGQSGLPSADAD
jgi:hypothetical protein